MDINPGMAVSTPANQPTGTRSDLNWLIRNGCGHVDLNHRPLGYESTLSLI